MRSFSTLAKLAGFLLVIGFLALGTVNRQNVFADSAIQSTDAPTMAATEAPAMAATAEASMVSTMAATTAVVSASATTYPPCPAPVATAADTSATDSAATAEMAATAVVPADATLAQAATMAATANPTPAYLGVKAEQVEACGSRILEVVAGGPASKSTLQGDDVVVALNGVAVPSVAILRREIESRQPGDKVTLTVERKGTQVDVEVTLGAKPVDTTSAVAGTTTATVETPAATMAATQ
ncbi:MAG: PDZ domain-containing protein [Chloroflexota bacterium]